MSNVTEKQFFETLADLFNMYYTVYKPEIQADLTLCEFGGLLYEIGGNFDCFKDYFHFSNEPENTQ